MTPPLCRRPAVFAAFPELLAAESTRHGGVSQPPYDRLNLGGSTADDPQAVAENRRIFYEHLGITDTQVASSHQVHGSCLWLTDAPGRRHGHDGILTATPGVYTLVTVADCTPVLVYDARTRAVAALHAGWRGTVAGIVQQALAQLQQAFGTRPADCHAYVGTCIDACHFEVGEEVAGHFAEGFKRYDAQRGRFFVDLKQANAAQLRAFGLPEKNIEISPWSTVTHNADYFSHRHSGGLTGRMVALIGVRA